ncbi:MAG: hypothetical protein OEM59_04865 [Rhodospirillales bacterium]|nr:hypothetical protein [Rhodospirillales bacterium]
MEKTAAIDKVMHANLNDVTAVQFLEALNAQGMTLVAKDKRVEYWTEPERVVPSVSIEAVIEKFKNRKKWYEREKFPGFERHSDVLDIVSNPALLNRLADVVAQRIQQAGGVVVTDG